MKSLYLLISLAVCVTTLLPAQNQESTQIEVRSPWQVLLLASGDPTAADTITENIRSGYMPVGLEVNPGEGMSVLFVSSGSWNPGRWAIIDYGDWNALEGEITGGIQDGFAPMDISRYEDVLAVLWVQVDFPIEGWRISTSPNTLDDRRETVNRFQEDGFTLWGLSLHEDLVWYLFLRTDGVPRTGAVTAFSNNTEALQSGISRASDEGWLPNGLANDSDTIYVGFVR